MDLPLLSISDATALLKGDFGAELIRLVANYTTFLTFGKVSDSGEAEIQSGTCFFIQTPFKFLAVTARHVYDGYLRNLERDSETICQIENHLFDPKERLVGKGERVDIATFQVTEAEIKNFGKKPISIWPPDPPTCHDTGLLLAGFPALEKKMIGPRTGIFGMYAAVAVATAVSDHQITTDIIWEESHEVKELGKLPPKSFDTGGMSGGPILTIRERNGLISFPLAGVISEGYAARDRIIGERADNIRANGSIRG